MAEGGTIENAPTRTPKNMSFSFRAWQSEDNTAKKNAHWAEVSSAGIKSDPPEAVQYQLYSAKIEMENTK